MVPAYHTEFGLAAICLKSCGAISVACESNCEARRLFFLFSTSEESALVIFTRRPTIVELVQIKNTRQSEVGTGCVFLSGIGPYAKNR